MASRQLKSASNMHWHLQYDNKGILWMLLDKSGSDTNVLSRDVLDQLDQHLDAVMEELPVAVIFRSAKASGFIAGADIKEFLQVDSEQEALALIQRGQKVFDKIAALPCPTIAVIEGFCMGGGTELTLACDYRIALDEPRTQIGLPEVRLGIHPAFGGLVRVTRLLNPLQSLPMMVSGRSFSAREARKVGLVDYVQPERQLTRAATRVALSTPDKRSMPLPGKILSLPVMRRLVVWFMKQRLSKKAPVEHYPAPHALLDVWEKYYGRPKMMRQEALSVARLVQGNTVGNLIRVFFLQSKLKGLGQKNAFQPRHVHVIGAGVMGSDLAALCALKGFKVTLQEREPRYLCDAFKRAHQLFAQKLELPHLRDQASDRLIPDCQGFGMAHADVIIEAVFEDAATKQKLLGEVEAQMKPDALVVTTTSSLPLNTLGQGMQQPERLIGIHAISPLAKSLLVEIVASDATTMDAQRKACAFSRHLDKLPLPVRSSPGFLVNRILLAYLIEAIELYEEGVAAEAIDQAATDFGMSTGPLELADVIGLDLCLSVAENLSRRHPFKIPEILRNRVKTKSLGKKSGEGFYHYKNGKTVRDRDVNLGDQTEIQQRMIYRLLNESAACLREQVIGHLDLVDAGAVFGVGFPPFHGGPLSYARQVGVNTLQQQMVRLQQKFGDRFKPDAGWDQV